MNGASYETIEYSRNCNCTEYVFQCLSKSQQIVEANTKFHLVGTWPVGTNMCWRQLVARQQAYDAPNAPPSYHATAQLILGGLRVKMRSDDYNDLMCFYEKEENE